MSSAIRFDLSGYFSIVERAKAKGFHAMPFADAMTTEEERVLILRHDVDFSLQYAYELSLAETRRGIRSTYFILLYNDYYDPLTSKGESTMREMVQNGHEIGLHWDSSLYPKEAAELQRHFTQDIESLGSALGTRIQSASQHIPTDTPGLDVEKYVRYETYSEEVRSRFSYVSDSSMQWREYTPIDLIETETRIQFLAHPIWWIADGDSAVEKMRTLYRENPKLRETTEEFIEYMNEVLADRKEYDRRFDQAMKDRKSSSP